MKLSINDNQRINVFNILRKSERDCNNNFKNLVEFAFCLPGTSAAFERVFLMNNIWPPGRGTLLIRNVKELLLIKRNVEYICLQFYEKIERNVVFLKKVLPSQKYQWAQKETERNNLTHN